MMLEQGQYFKSIKEELDSISIVNSPSSMEFPVIESVEVFSKTQVYQSLRKGQLSDEELSFVINNYNYAGNQLVQLILSKVKDLTMTKAISIGAVSRVLAQRNTSSYYNNRNNFEYVLKALIRIKDYESELMEFIKFFKYRKTHKMDNSYDRRVFETFLKIFWYDYSMQYSSESLAERMVAAKAIKNHYKDIYELLEEPKKTKSASTTFSVFNHLLYPFHDCEIEEPLKAFENVKKEENRERINHIIETISNCPYADMDFLLDLINDDKKLESVDKIYLLITCLISSYAPSFIGFNEWLSKIEMLHKKWGVKESLADLTSKSMSSNSSRLDFSLGNLKYCKKLTKERRKEIYLTYFASQKPPTIYGYHKFKMDLMIVLQLDDEEVADFLRGCGRYNIFGLKSCYSCTPSDRSSYPGPKTLLELVKRDHLEEYTASNRAMPSQKIQKSDEDLILDNYYFNSRNREYDDDVLITWEMANSPEFMKKIIFSDSGKNNYRLNKIIAKMNLKSIGFKKYVTYLEDYARENKLNTFSTVSRDALGYATQSELYMYKRMIPRETLCSSPYINFKTINHFLSKYETTKEREGHGGELYSLPITLVSSIKRNKVLSKEELVNIITRIGESKAAFFKLFSISSPIGSRTLAISIKTALDTKITVKDFSDYYDSLEEVK